MTSLQCGWVRDEWLVRTDDGKEPALSVALLEAIEGKHAAVTAGFRRIHDFHGFGK